MVCFTCLWLLLTIGQREYWCTGCVCLLVTTKNCLVVTVLSYFSCYYYIKAPLLMISEPVYKIEFIVTVLSYFSCYYYIKAPLLMISEPVYKIEFIVTVLSYFSCYYNIKAPLLMVSECVYCPRKDDHAAHAHQRTRHGGRRIHHRPWWTLVRRHTA